MIKRFSPPAFHRRIINEGPSSLAFQLFGSKVPVFWHFGSLVRRSQFFGISALQFEGPGSFFDNFSALAFSSTFRF
ncbi:unnamed protein product [Rhizophagus irregularis]|nr:unnamed protein product [Rhizophagus irregularis]CAB4411344.1 unnamed protein product [Rhizophagus irregularis]